MFYPVGLISHLQELPGGEPTHVALEFVGGKRDGRKRVQLLEHAARVVSAHLAEVSVVVVEERIAPGSMLVFAHAKPVRATWRIALGWRAWACIVHGLPLHVAHTVMLAEMLYEAH